MDTKPKYTPEQVEDIKARELKALESLKDLEFNPSATVIAINLGQDIFGFKVVPFLADLKYLPKAEQVDEPVPSTDAEVNPVA